MRENKQASGEIPSQGPASRRAVLAVGGTVATASLAGCADFFADLVLGDVNVNNGSDIPLSGTVSIVDPDGETILEESFEIDEHDSDGSDDQVEYDDVWAAAGEYEASIELDDELDGTSSDTDSVTVDDPDEERLMIGLGADEFDDTISMVVAADMEELEEIADIE